MSQVKSIFGGYADKLQVMVDKSKDRFAPVWYSRYFKMGIQKTTLTFQTVIGRSRIEAAASIVNRDSSAPLRSRAALEKLNGEIPAIMQKFKMTDNEYRDFLTLQALTTSDEVKKNQILNLIWDDVEKCGNAAHKKLDLMVLEALSTGFITVDINNNPDGINTSEQIDLLMPSDNFVKVTKNWNSPSTAKPITDIRKVVRNAKSAGKASLVKMLMSETAFYNLQMADETRNLVAGMLRITAKEQIMPTEDEINMYLKKNRLPVIEIVDEVIGIEKDGKIDTKTPWKAENVTFVPEGQLGTIHNAVAVETLSPVPQVSYATYNNALISKWKENDPFGEYTKVEFNAFPGVEAIDNIYILLTDQEVA